MRTKPGVPSLALRERQGISWGFLCMGRAKNGRSSMRRGVLGEEPIFPLFGLKNVNNLEWALRFVVTELLGTVSSSERLIKVACFQSTPAQQVTKLQKKHRIST
jgi:hypothetical protein